MIELNSALKKQSNLVFILLYRMRLVVGIDTLRRSLILRKFSLLSLLSRLKLVEIVKLRNALNFWMIPLKRFLHSST